MSEAFDIISHALRPLDGPQRRRYSPPRFGSRTFDLEDLELKLVVRYRVKWEDGDGPSAELIAADVWQDDRRIGPFDLSKLHALKREEYEGEIETSVRNSEGTT